MTDITHTHTNTQHVYSWGDVCGPRRQFAHYRKCLCKRHQVVRGECDDGQTGLSYNILKNIHIYLYRCVCCLPSPRIGSTSELTLYERFQFVVYIVDVNCKFCNIRFKIVTTFYVSFGQHTHTHNRFYCSIGFIKKIPHQIHCIYTKTKVHVLAAPLYIAARRDTLEGVLRFIYIYVYKIYM